MTDVVADVCVLRRAYLAGNFVEGRDASMMTSYFGKVSLASTSAEACDPNL